MGDARRRSVATVLLVDDYEVSLNGWERELERTGKRVLRATNRRAVARAVSEYPPDLALVDLFLGGENGLDIVRDLKALDPDPFVVLVTGAPSVAYTMEAVRAGADDVYAKPVAAASLVQLAEAGEVERDLDKPPTLDQLEWEHVTRALLDCNGNVSQAARRLGIYRQTLQRKMRKHVPR